MSHTTKRIITAIAMATFALTSGAGLATAETGSGNAHNSTEGAYNVAPSPTVNVPGVSLPGVSVDGISAGPGGVAIGGPTVGLPTELSPFQ
ncbi:hypothetical protein Rwratislav_44086 [Rhodococcus wratislaviensis IFP 2016]|nr:hypothetical protein Rwratislav_44086 [Rhodococcus wratislaviensis IFP 2016]